ncbi:restriction endonuclease subunit S [Enterococcus faecium]|uniref:restriction endonuclease subunit S n=1 Tax=Enterococcus faecium TaxID=1352 RepID=UPI0029539450|nr:restriction endonuclease subunit S [Enterococcus faecium]MDV7722357.1 restriction endonuclease subunit S [Enterococcus faecium]
MSNDTQPEIRFPGFTDDWEQRKLKEFGKSTGGTSIESEFVEGGKYKVISIGSYSEQSVYTDQNIRAELTDKTRNRVLNKGDLTMILNDKTASGNIIGRVLLIDSNDSYVYNQRTERIEPDHKKYDSQFLYHMLNAPMIRSKIIKQAQGNTQIYVNWSAIGELDYLVPNLDEQREIGAFFFNLNNLITLHQRKLDLLKETKKGFLQKMFPKNGAKVPEIRFPGFTGDWEQRKLGDAADIVGGGTPSTANPEYWDGDIDWYAPAEIGEQIYVSKSQRTITELGQQKSSAKILPVGTVLFTSRAGIGNTAILAKEATTNQGFQSIVPHKDKLDSYFIFSRTNELKRYGEVTGAGSTFVEVSGKQMAKMPLLIPSIAEQRQIGSFFKQLDNTITLHQRKLDLLKETKKGFLQKMFV